MNDAGVGKGSCRSRGGGEMITRDVIILANSRKYSGHCIAGKDLKTREWVRLINNKVDQQKNPIPFTPADLKALYGDTNGPKLLQCIRVPFNKKCSIYCQPENEEITGAKWEILGRILPKDLHKIEDRMNPDWIGKPGIGASDSIPYRECNPQKPLSCSLFLTKLSKKDHDAEILHTTSARGTRQHRLKFTINQLTYSLVITDLHYEQDLPEGILEKNNSSVYATIGVGQIYPRMMAHYKLVVGFIPMN